MSTEAELAIVNARVWTNDPHRPWADAVFVRGDLIEVVGSSAEVKKRAGAEARTIDARGMMIVPGAIDPLSDSLLALYTAVNRRTLAGAGAPKKFGMLGTGMIADFTIIDRDLARIAEEMIGDARVVLTVVSGRILYDRGNSSHEESQAP